MIITSCEALITPDTTAIKYKAVDGKYVGSGSTPEEAVERCKKQRHWNEVCRPLRGTGLGVLPSYTA